MQILSPRRRVDTECKQNVRPYGMPLFEVNGVGKPTDLPKTCFRLFENHFCALIAACDRPTFRAGAAEHSHTRHLNALHPADKHGSRQLTEFRLYEKGYVNSFYVNQF